ncbi:hypothetical protein [Streptomyces sp. NPDC003077]|uniref:hypothetical protein n=1 Tax=Streptomyces sp. NPDC003077 TaxID=3154443 RepID=UPI0033B6F2BD
MSFGFVPSARGVHAPSADSAARLSRMLEPAEWASAGIPLLRNPREIVTGLHDRHLPRPSTAVVAVLDAEERVLASASFRQGAAVPDGWDFRNALLARLRQVVPHDLRLRAPVRTAVLLYCREGTSCWTEADGAWMWGLRDACTLHGLRCGAYITLTRDGWQVLGEGRGGRRPHSGLRSRGTRPLESRSPEGLDQVEGVPLGTPGPAAARGRTSAPTRPSAPPRNGGPSASRRPGGGPTEAQRHTAAR